MKSLTMQYLSLLIVVLISISASLSPAFSQPMCGDVFREYTWKSDKYQVVGKAISKFAIPDDLDLHHAIRAEIIVEIANEHLGFETISIRMNGNEWRPVLYPDHEQSPTPSLWFYHWYPIIPVSLNDLKSSTINEIEMQIDSLCFDGKQHPNGRVTSEHPEGEWGLLVPWCPVYGMTLRVYYQAERKKHLSGSIISPPDESVIGRLAPLQVSVVKSETKIRQIDFIGKYQDINYEGDGNYRQWHYHLFQGKIRDHLGTVTSEDSICYWNTEWVPDQSGPIEIAAFITDESGLTYMTESIRGLKLERHGLSVELCRPYEVPRSFTGCQYGTWIFEGTRTEKFYVQGDLSKIIDARYVIASWGDLEGNPGYMINNIMLAQKPMGENWFYNLSKVPIEPLSALIYGENTFSTVVHGNRMPDIYMPGVQVLIRYRSE